MAYAGTADFTLTVTNPGDVPLTNVVVTDPQCDGIPKYESGDTPDPGGDGVLTVGETWIYTCSTSKVTEDFTNTAFVTGKDPLGNEVKDDDSADVEVLKADITVVKEFVGAPEGSTVTIRLSNGGGLVNSRSVADGGSINDTVAPGEFTADETSVGSNVDLANYDQSIECLNGEKPVASSPDTSSAMFDAKDGDNIICTIKNQRLPQMKVDKVVDSSQEDGGMFNLEIDGSTAGIGGDVGDGGTTGWLNVKTGEHTASESAGTDTSLDDYVSATVCSVNGGEPVDKSMVDLAHGDKVTVRSRTTASRRSRSSRCSTRPTIRARSTSRSTPCRCSRTRTPATATVRAQVSRTSASTETPSRSRRTATPTSITTIRRGPARTKRRARARRSRTSISSTATR